MRHLVFGIVLALSFLTSQAANAVVILDETRSGDNGGSPFTFNFSDPAPKLFGFLDMMDEYDALGVAITDVNGFVLAPLITFNPATDISFMFDATTGNYTASVSAIGQNGSFRLQIATDESDFLVSVNEPASFGLLALGLAGLVAMSRRRQRASWQAAEKLWDRS